MEEKSCSSSKSEAVPEDMQREILVRLPYQSLVKFTSVSKKWESIIHDKHFNNVYLPQSMKKPRMLFMFNRGKDLLIFSINQEGEPRLSRQQQMRISVDMSYYDVSQSIRGLIRLSFGAKVVLCNPTMNKFKTLPEIQSPLECRVPIQTFFGYDESMNVFKVLCMKMLEYDRPLGTKEHQVLTVGSNEESWRPIVCKHRHYPVTNGLCNRGVVYYGAWSGPDNKSVLMSFVVKSEEFTVINLPEGVIIQDTDSTSLVNYNERTSLVYYNGEIALVIRSNDDRVVMWVRNGVSGDWTRKHIHRWSVTQDKLFSFRGTIGTGELVYTPNRLCDRSLSVLYYNPITHTRSELKIEEVVDGPEHFQRVRTVLDHADTFT